MRLPLICTGRLTLRPYREGDEQAIFELLEKNRVQLRSLLPPWAYEMHSPEQMPLFIKKMNMGWLLRNYMSAGIWLEDGNKLAGELQYFNARWEVPELELGYYLAKDFQGQGIIKEALWPWLQFGFEDLGVNRIFLHTLFSNAASRQIAQQAGFKQAGPAHERTAHGNVLYELHKENFKRLPA